MDIGASETRSLRCELNPDEQADRAHKSTELLRQRDAIDSEAKDAAKKAKEQVKQLDDLMRKNAAAARDGYEHRPVECEWHLDHVDGQARLVRTDTMDTVDVRPLSDQERQLGLPSIARGKKKPPAGN